jgi:hypothetical protein
MDWFISPKQPPYLGIDLGIETFAGLRNRIPAKKSTSTASLLAPDKITLKPFIANQRPLNQIMRTVDSVLMRYASRISRFKHAHLFHSPFIIFHIKK